MESVKNEPSVAVRRRVIARFIRQYRRVEDARKRVPENPVRLSLSFTEQRLSAELHVEDAMHRLVIGLRPFLQKESGIELRDVFAALKEHRPEGFFSEQEVVDFDAAMKALEEEDSGLHCDERAVTRRESYDYIADGGYFDEKDEAVEFLKGLEGGPALSILRFHFFSVSLDALRIASWLYRCMQEPAAGRAAVRGETSPIQGDCIFCRKADGGFTSQDHVFPESLAGDDEVLPRGYVCDRCNHGALSHLDEALANFPPIAVLRVFYLPFTKKGKLPDARIGQLSLRKRFPRVIRIQRGSNRAVFTDPKPLPDGMVGHTLRMEVKANWRQLARAFFRMALNVIAFRQGRDRACAPEFDAARRFILGDQDFQGYFIIASQGKPTPEVQVRVQDAPAATLVALSVYGVYGEMNLQETPLSGDVMEIAREAAEKGFGMIPLFGEPVPLVPVVPEEPA